MYKVYCTTTSPGLGNKALVQVQQPVFSAENIFTITAVYFSTVSDGISKETPWKFVCLVSHTYSDATCSVVGRGLVFNNLRQSNRPQPSSLKVPQQSLWILFGSPLLISESLST
jgi:hypothetical protein